MAGRVWIEVFEDAAGEWRWHFKSANGKIRASGEAHAERRHAVAAATDLAADLRAGDIEVKIVASPDEAARAEKAAKDYADRKAAKTGPTAVDEPAPTAEPPDDEDEA